ALQSMRRARGQRKRFGAANRTGETSPDNCAGVCWRNASLESCCCMTWIVRVALERPLTFIVMAILIVIAGPLAAMQKPTDIFPDIKIPVIGVAFQYTGLSPDEMAGRIISPYERGLTTTVNDIEHIESTSLPGMGIEKIYFQPGVDIRTATAQVTSISQTSIKQMPAGTTPPLILNYNASTVPILQLAFSGEHMSEQQVLDLAQNFVRPVLT